MGQFNDHFLLTVNTPPHATVDSVEAQLRREIEYIREHSINFDKVLEVLRESDVHSFDRIRSVLACGPLGELSVRRNSAGTVYSIPRPTWGRNSFNPPRREREDRLL